MWCIRRTEVIHLLRYFQKTNFHNPDWIPFSTWLYKLLHLFFMSTRPMALCHSSRSRPFYFQFWFQNFFTQILTRFCEHIFVMVGMHEPFAISSHTKILIERHLSLYIWSLSILKRLSAKLNKDKFTFMSCYIYSTSSKKSFEKFTIVTINAKIVSYFLSNLWSSNKFGETICNVR